MEHRERNEREVALPASALVELRRALRREAGPLATTHALHAAGFDAGSALHTMFAAGTSRPLATLSEEAFWDGLRDFLGRRGWGTLKHERVHPALGMMTSSDWAEAGHEVSERQPSCAFTSGMLASILGEVAGGPIAVLEVQCRSRGDDACRFAMGSETAVHELYGKLLDGAALEVSLREL
ncbi:MAG: 4-vinyl reductase [Gemmatimonadota bacterium]